ncbi:hypothetical protein C0081_11660 [Cohaesibacter celericrescens]|uniref:Uncharacterized protein n=1 Tax=Cohaesibacter celericrescens TaxID=2067669 RepID=A0A2N5XQK1_9HYPH|nr:hypothetical protein C0081_11660 [Cohaesibacter celericrescens]
MRPEFNTSCNSVVMMQHFKVQNNKIHTKKSPAGQPLQGKSHVGQKLNIDGAGPDCRVQGRMS